MDKLKCYNCDKDAQRGSVFCSDKCKIDYAEANNIPKPTPKNTAGQSMSFEQKLNNFRHKYHIKVKTQAEREAELVEAEQNAWLTNLFNRVDQYELQNNGVRQ